jgi:hypothetical protein|tara:strand:+ start:370 stop:576 length:207 start_codon:yes stop_codon:yes gene_type:complete
MALKRSRLDQYWDCAVNSSKLVFALSTAEQEHPGNDKEHRPQFADIECCDPVIVKEKPYAKDNKEKSW